MKKNIGIVTFNDAFNYGAFLQEYALMKYVQMHSYNAEVINYKNSFFSQQYLYSCNPVKKKGIMEKIKILYNMIFRPVLFRDRLRQKKKFLDAIEREIKLSPVFQNDMKNNIDERYDFFLAGSDQVWNIHLTRNDQFYFLNFVSNNKKKGTYAVSFGRDRFEGDNLKLILSNLEGFGKILVREESGKRFLNEHGFDSEVVLDPTFLISKEKWTEFASKSNISYPRKYILIYLVVEQKNLLDLALKYAEINDCEIILIRIQNKSLNHRGKKIKAMVDVGPYDFVNLILHAEKVFTTSFHGVALSINLNIDFFYELCHSNVNSNGRIKTIVNNLNLNNREISGCELKEESIDWDMINQNLEKLRGISQTYLLEEISKC